MSGLALWLLVALPAVLGAALCLAGPRGDRVAAPAALGGAAAVAALGVATAISRPRVQAPFLAGEPFSLGVDALSAVVVPTVAVIALLVLVFAAGERPAPEARFYGLMLLFTAAVEVTATAESLLGLLFAWEVMGATSYALIGYRWRELDRPAAGANAFLTTRLADLGLYVAAGAALAGGSGLSLSALGGLGPGWRDVAAGGLLVAALGKAAQLPFTPWLSRAMEGPSAVSALLHSAAMVAMGGYLLLRASPLLLITGWAATTAAWVGALTALLLGAVALAQRDLKQVLAASTAAQLGFVVLAAGVGSVAGGAAQLVAHAATKALLFLAAGAWLSALGTKQLGALRGAARRWPVVGAAFAVGALSLAGIPPLSLWATKDAVPARPPRRSTSLGWGVRCSPPRTPPGFSSSSGPGSRRTPRPATTTTTRAPAGWVRRNKVCSSRSRWVRRCSARWCYLRWARVCGPRWVRRGRSRPGWVSWRSRRAWPSWSARWWCGGAVLNSAAVGGGGRSAGWVSTSSAASCSSPRSGT